MKIEKFSKENIVEVRKEIEEAFKILSDHFGLEFNLGRMKYFESEFKAELHVKIPGKIAVSQQQIANVISQWSLKEEAYIPGYGMCKLVDYKSRAHKNKYVFQVMKNGERRLCNGMYLRKFFGTPNTPTMGF